MAELSVQLEPMVEAAYRPFEDGERRWLDLDIAEWLGLADVHKIRDTIQSNRNELERHGPVSARQAETSTTGGRPGTEYWLTFEQAMVVCTQSRTKRAEDVRTVMIQVFSKFRKGELSTMPRMEIRALEVAADRIVAPILREQREFHSEVLTRMDRHEKDIAVVKRDIVEIRREGLGRRKPFKAGVRETYIEVVVRYFNCLCPSCRVIRIIGADGTCSAEIDHWYGPAKHHLQHGWLVCTGCNRRMFNDPEFKTSRSGAFSVFQENVRLSCESEEQQQVFRF